MATGTSVFRTQPTKLRGYKGRRDGRHDCQVVREKQVVTGADFAVLFRAVDKPVLSDGRVLKVAPGPRCLAIALAPKEIEAVGFAGPGSTYQ